MSIYSQAVNTLGKLDKGNTFAEAKQRRAFNALLFRALAESAGGRGGE